MPIDSENMLKALEEFPIQCREALTLPKGMYLQEDVNQIVVIGMGGSAIAGDLLKSYLEESSLPVHVVRDTKVPGFVNKNTLVFAVSYSGNTEETLRATKDAIRKEAIVVGISSGGKLKDLCKRFVPIPGGIQPRCAMGYLFFPMIGILHNSQMIVVRNAELNEMLAQLSLLESFKERAQKLVKVLKNKTPVVYAPQSLYAAAMRWKTQINENAKTPAFYNTFSEMNHNEIVGYETMNRSEFLAIVLRDPAEDKKMQKRIDVSIELMEETVDVEQVYAKGDSFLCRLMTSIFYGDFLSYYLAMDKRIDPSPVKIIENVKKALE